ncbi:dipeptidase PepV [Bacillus shivajii]|uniref:dipeptidase PepV n=1 Tax=Bacillus shivajii TaxID=1983719 RepID=UPI001CFB59D0|nr:dipeptidase PepV [Bacillus shivajii]UCZ51436.1 dipeptidase PepV [Bacillus shivajii]
MNWYKEVLKRKNDLLEDLTQLLKLESTKDSTSELNNQQPMGENIAKALDYMLNLSSQTGLSTKNGDGYYGYAELIGSNQDEHIAVLCHVDVVPATGQWTSPPYEPTIRDRKLYARGAIDDKGPTMAAFYAMKMIKELQLPMKRNVRIIFGTDEESGMSCIKKYRDIEKPPVAGFAPDATFPIIHAEKGQIHAKFAMKKVSTNTEAKLKDDILLSFHAGTRGNMVPENATATLSGNLKQIESTFLDYLKKHHLYGEITKDNDNKTITLTLKGISAHSMEPFKGLNAGVSLAKFLSFLPLDINGENYISFIKQKFADDHYGEKLNIYHEDEITGSLTVNPAIFRYGLENEAFVQANIRYPVTAKFETIERNIMDTIKSYNFYIDEIRYKQPHHVDKNTSMIKALQLAYENETGDEPTLLSSGGNTYASLLPNCVAYGAVFPGKEMTAHQKDEYIEIDDLLKATSIYAQAIYNLANMEDEM